MTYSHPEVSSVGRTGAAAKEQYGEVQIFTYDLTGNDKNQIVKTAGAVELVRAADGPLVGLHVGGDRVGELVGEAQLIYNRRPISCTPTRTEALGEAHLALASKPPHVHG